MTGEERQKDFQKVVKMAQDRILDFLETYSDSETLKKARSTFAQHPVMLSEHETQRDELSGRDESAAGVAGKDTITIDDNMFVSSSTNNHHELDELLGTIIHEYAHEFRKDNDTNYQKSFEESAASIFSEMCINHANAKSIGSAAELFQCRDIFDYRYSQNELRAILYVLKQHNLDVTLLTKYVFGDEIDFVKKCCEIFGDKFLDYFNEAIGKRTDQKQDSKSQDMLNDIMKDYISNNKLSFKDYEAKKDASTLYNPTSSVIARSVTELSDSALLDDEKEYYEYFAYDNKFYNDILNDSNNSARERITNFINTRYSLEGKNPEQIYDTLIDLVSDYNSYRTRTDDYGRTYITELRARIPNIDEIALNFTQTRVDGLRSEMFATIAPRGISYNVIGQTLRQYVPGGSARVNVGGTINTTTTVSGAARNVARGVTGTVGVGVGVAGATVRAAQGPSTIHATVNENINTTRNVDVTSEVTQNVTSTDTVTTTTTTSTIPGTTTTTVVDSAAPAGTTVVSSGATSAPGASQTVTSTPGGGVSTITPGGSERGRVGQGQNVAETQTRPGEVPTNQEGQTSGEAVQGGQEQPVNEGVSNEQPVDDGQQVDEPQNVEEPSNEQEPQESENAENPEDVNNEAEGTENTATGEGEPTEGEQNPQGQEPNEGESPEDNQNPEKQNQSPDATNKDENKPESEEDDFNNANNRNNHNQRLNNQENLPEEEGPNKYRKNNNFNQRQNAAKAADAAKDGADAAKKGADAAKTADAAKKGADAAKKAEAAKKGAEAAKTAEAAGAAKAGEKGILAFFKAYPWVAIIIIVVIILILIILTVIITFTLDEELKQMGKDSDTSEVSNNKSYKEIVDATGTCMPFSVENTKLSKKEFKERLVEYSNSYSNQYFSVFVDNADTIYDISTTNNINPELVVIRAIAEGYSPVSQGYSSYNNYWGLECYNGKPLSTCKSFSTFDEGVLDFVQKIKRYSEGEDNIFKVMSHYVSLGTYWYNPGNSGLGGCYYKDYVAQYLPENLKADVYNACSGKACSGADCVPTTLDQQNAYYNYQVNTVMSPKRQSVFKLENDTCKPSANMTEVQLGSAIVKYSIERFDDFGYSQPDRHSSNYVDCSSLVNRTFNELFGVDIYLNVEGYPKGDVTGPEYNWCVTNGKMISEDELIPGDIIFWTGDSNHYGNIGHVAFYVGEENGKRLQFAAHTSKTDHDNQVSVTEYKNNGSYFCRPIKGENWTSEKL